MLDAVIADGPLQRLAVSFLFGMLVGLERYTHGRPAGLRTHILVCLSSCAIMLVPEHLLPRMPGSTAGGVVDPTRVIQGALTGIGFLGAGVILKEGTSVYGLTTAACIWMIAVIGLIVGSGMYFVGAAALVLTLVTLVNLRVLERFLRQDVYRTVTAEFGLPATKDAVARIVAALDPKCAMRRREIAGDRGSVSYVVAARGGPDFDDLAERLRALPGVTRVAVSPVAGE
jgi:putative Mg2+ transporter-C (MgtC) family protein